MTGNQRTARTGRCTELISGGVFSPDSNQDEEETKREEVSEERRRKEDKDKERKEEDVKQEPQLTQEERDALEAARLAAMLNRSAHRLRILDPPT